MRTFREPVLYEAERRSVMLFADVQGAAQHLIQRLDFLAHKLVNPLQLRSKIRIGFKIPRNGSMLLQS